MKSLNMVTSLIAFVALALIPATFAQERTAAGTTETQMTWTTLSAKAEAAKFAADAVDIRVNQVAACGRKGLLYAPGGVGIDGEGCKAPQSGNTDARWDRNAGFAWAGPLLIQWGRGCPPAGGSVYVNTPIGFPNGIMNAVALIDEPHYGATRANQFVRPINNHTIEVGKAGLNGCLNWMAIGH